MLKVIAKVKEIVERQMEREDKTMGKDLQMLLSTNGINVASTTALRCRTNLGWTFKLTAYCQMIRDANEKKILDWAKENKDMSFDDVI